MIQHLQVNGLNPLDHTLLPSTRLNRPAYLRKTILRKKPTRVQCIKLQKPASMALAGIVRDLAAKPTPVVATAAVGGLSVLLTLVFFFFRGRSSSKNKGSSKLQSLPVVPGLPIIGNLLQLKERKPHRTFAKWAETYGPIYSIKTGATTMVVLNSTEVAKEAMVTRYSSICTRNLSTALQILTANKCMVAMSDYNDFHKTAKRHILTSVLGPAAQRRFRCHRSALVEDVVAKLLEHANRSPDEAINFREVFENELFGLSFKEAVGEEVQSLYVEELGITFSKKDIFKVLVTDFMEGAVEVDWRNFFPYLKWVPNKTWENKIHRVASRRNLLMKALIRQQKERILSSGVNCYLSQLLSEGTTLTEDEIVILLWEAIIEAADTTLVTTEWALYELSKDPSRQDRLYQEIQKICGSERIAEENVSKIPFLGAVFHETLRKHSPVPIIPPRYVHEDTEIGGYFIPKGTEIAVNLYGCNRDKKQWGNPDEWVPERFLDDKYDPADLYKTMAFGAGKRVCAGSLQASLISCIAIGRLVQEFEWSVRGAEEDDVDTAGLTGYKLRPLHAVLKPRKQQP